MKVVTGEDFTGGDSSRNGLDDVAGNIVGGCCCFSRWDRYGLLQSSVPGGPGHAIETGQYQRGLIGEVAR